MLITLFNSLFGNSKALDNAKIERDRDVLTAECKLVVFNLAGDTQNIALYAQAVRELHGLLSSWDNELDLHWRCYVSGYNWHVMKDKQGKVSIQGKAI